MRESWSSQTGFVLATAGAAIGLGQIWKFPYMAGQNGGAGFILAYLLFVFLLAIPAFVGEVLLGVLGKSNPIGTLSKLSEGRAKGPWIILACLGLATLFLILCFYNVAASWSLAMLGALREGVSDTYFQSLLASPLSMGGYFLLYSGVAFGVVAMGLGKGIERFCFFLLPVLLFLLLGIVVWAFQLPGFSRAIEFMFLDFKALSASSLLEAAGHSLFSMATGTGCALVYGSHMPSGVSLGRATLAVGVCNILVALLVVLGIFPIAFSFDLEIAGGPTLMYHVLPVAFAQMSGGWVLAGLFFCLLFVAALTSSFSLIEPLVGTLVERRGFGRKQACLLVALVTLVPSALCILSFNELSEIRIFGLDIFSFIADLLVSVLLCVGALGFSIFAAFILPKDNFAVLGPIGKGIRFLLMGPIPAVLLALLAAMFF